MEYFSIIFSRQTQAFGSREVRPGGGEGAGRCVLERGFPGPRVSDAETLSLQKSAKNRSKDAELATLRQLHFCS
jgi:hypothetical protein